MIDDKLYKKAIKQYKELVDSKNHLQIALAINKGNLESIEWMEKFIYYIKKNHINKYNEACDYANIEEK